MSFISQKTMFFFFSSRRRHTRCGRDWSSDVCSSDLWFPPNIRRAFASFFENWEETSTYGVVIISGATAAVEGTVTGRHRTLHLRIPGRIPTSSRAYRHNFAMFVEMEGGKIHRQRVYFDARDLVKQLLGDI